MAETVTLTLPEEILAQARETAQRTGQSFESVLTEWLKRSAAHEGIPPEVESAAYTYYLAHESHEAAQALHDMLADDDEEIETLDQARARLGDNPPRTGAEILAYMEREGLLGTRPDITDPLKHAQALRRRAERRKRD